MPQRMGKFELSGTSLNPLLIGNDKWSPECFLTRSIRRDAHTPRTRSYKTRALPSTTKNQKKSGRRVHCSPARTAAIATFAAT